MNWFPGMPSVLQSFKVYTCLIPLACLLHKLSRVMGWTKRRDRSITLAGRVHTSPPGIFVGEFFKVPFVPVCDFDPDTFPDQIVGEVPKRLMDRIAEAGNACKASRRVDEKSSGGRPLEAGDVIDQVNDAIASGDRATILTLATRLDALNNGPGGCPLGGPDTR